MTQAVYLLVIAHAPLAGALRAGAVHVFEDSAGCIVAYDVPPHEAPETTLAQLHTLTDTLPLGAPLLVLSDVAGATPCNVAQRLVQGRSAAHGGETQLLAGANLPMLLRAYCYRHLPVLGVAQKALEGGAAAMVVVPCAATERATEHVKEHAQL